MEEYGGMPADNTSSNVVSTRNVYINGAPSGTITGGNVTVCSGTNSTTLTLTGLSGSVVRWEYSTDNFLTAGTTVSSTATSLTVTNLSETRYYRAIVNSASGCSGLATSSTPIFAAATVPGNIVAVSNTICPGGEAELTLYGNSGSVTKWQKSTSSTFASAVTDIASTATSLSHTLTSAGTWYFRAWVQNNGCASPVATGVYTITVTAGTPPEGGVVSSTEHCSGSNSGTLTLSGHTGSVQKWQYSTDGGIIWTDVANTTTSLSYSGVSSTRLYRAVLTNGSCGIAYSQNGTVTVFGNTQYKWLGSISSDGQVLNNWQCSNKPATGADVVISSSASNDLVLDQSYVLGNLDFSGSNRKIILGNYDLTVTSITGANASNYIRTTGTGRLRILVGNGQSVLFPVGNSAYNPVTIGNQSGAADEFRVQVLNEVYANGSSGATITQNRLRRTWDIHKVLPNGGSGVNFTFTWNAGETSASMASPSLYHYASGWSRQTGTTSASDGSLTYTGYTGTFSPFAVVDGASTLPVTWLYFNAVRENAGSSLRWATATEENTRDFTIEHSSNGLQWNSLGHVAAAGNSGMTQTYTYFHSKPAPGLNYYRILQRDLDGRSNYSRIVTLNFSGTPVFSWYPNPVRDLLTVDPGVTDTYELVVYNSVGMQVARERHLEGKRQVRLSQLPPGYYRAVISGLPAAQSFTFLKE